jgi:phosphatidylglycerol lysyltransferase
MRVKLQHRKTIQNIAVYLLVLIAVKNLLEALPLHAVQALARFYSLHIDPHAAVLSHSLSFVTGLLMLLLANRLYRRIRLAWVAEIVLISITVALQLVRYHRFTMPIVVLELFVLIVLCLSFADFTRRVDRLTLRHALSFIAASAAIVLLNATIGVFIMKQHYSNIHDFWDSLWGSVKLLVLLDTSSLQAATKAGRLYAVSLMVINWACMIIGVFLLLKPLVVNPIMTKLDRERVRKLVLSFGQNPMSYLALEDDKKYFFGRRIEGVAAYTVVNDVFVICGDMICSEADSFAFLSEILSYCRQNAYNVLVLMMNDSFRTLYQTAGFGIVKLGEECCFRLSDYSLAGGRAAKVRAAINHATKAGLTVHEYKPLQGRSADIERQFGEISAEWMKSKGGYTLRFTVGSVGLGDPMDRRYFYAADADGKIYGFIVFLPYTGGYLADVTRRRGDAIQGVLEKIIFEAFMQFKAEGVTWGNMGLSPLYNVADSDKAKMTERLFDFIYDNLNKSYGFRNLHHAKEKYGPTDWIPRYMAYYPKPFGPKLAYAIVRCQIKEGIPQLLLSQVLKKKDTAE